MEEKTNAVYQTSVPYSVVNNVIQVLPVLGSSIVVNTSTSTIIMYADEAALGKRVTPVGTVEVSANFATLIMYAPLQAVFQMVIVVGMNVVGRENASARDACGVY